MRGYVWVRTKGNEVTRLWLRKPAGFPKAAHPGRVKSPTWGTQVW